MTVSQNSTIRELLNLGNLNNLADLLRQIKIGNMQTLIKVTFTGLTSAAAQDITTAAAKAAATVAGITLRSGETLPPIGVARTLRVTAGALAAGDYILTDSGGTAKAIGTANNGVALISDDGKQITFQAAVTAFVLEYYPAAAVSLNTSQEIAAPF